MQNQISFYPNPASETIYFNSSLYDSIIIYDLAGKAVKYFEANSVEADISNISPGQYILQFISPSGTKTEKLIIK
ncbi:MAG: T9SS type A sorting domain-containing protein [Bacteroidetes bacterium]|nr:T9SS type A sorting domain-containing protein [Bacteroidota bacterium]